MNSVAFYQYLSHNGEELFTIICLPEKSGTFPTVIRRSPYVDDELTLSEEEICEKHRTDCSAWMDAGYAVVFQHCRGCGKSSGDFIPHVNETADGRALHAWVRTQPFYNGELYLYGGSYTAYVHFATAPFAEDIKGAVLEVCDTERYNWFYRNGLFKSGLLGNWFVKRYKQKSDIPRHFLMDSYRILPLSDFTKAVFDEPIEGWDVIFRHPDREDAFWSTPYGGADTRDVLNHARIPVLLTTGFYDIFVGGIFNMWNALDEETRSMCALAIHPFNHSCNGEVEPINFENGTIKTEFPNYPIQWFDAIRKNQKPPFEKGKVTYYKFFDNRWCTDDFYDTNETVRHPLGQETVTYKYNPYAPAGFRGGLSLNFGGNAWQSNPSSRYDIISVFTPEFEEDTFIKGKMKVKLKVSSDCEDTCFYVRLSLVKEEGYYGLRDDINQISNVDMAYVPGDQFEMDFSFDEHAFVVGKGEKIRIDISSSAFANFVPHTNHKGLFSVQTTAKIATNTVYLAESYLELPISK